MRFVTRYAFLTTALALAAACSDDGLTRPEDATLPDSRGVTSGSGAGGDSVAAPLPGAVQVSGRIIGVTVDLTKGSDSLRFEPIAGAAIQVHRNVLVDGQAKQVLVKELKSGADGSYVLADLPGGYYIVSAAPPAGSTFAPNWSYLPATTASVKVDVYLWRRN